MGGMQNTSQASVPSHVAPFQSRVSWSSFKDHDPRTAMKYRPMVLWTLVFVVVIVVLHGIMGSHSSSEVKESSSALRHSDGNCKEGDGRLVKLSDYPNAVCIDGTPGAYYYREGKPRSKSKWHIHFEGGGWCYNEAECIFRSKSFLGTSSLYPPCADGTQMKYYQSSEMEHNSLMHDWNYIQMKYCDSTSYAGDAVLYDQDGKKQYFMGRHIRDAAIDSILKMGMNTATEVVISGCSAGGLALYLGLDDMASRIRRANASTTVRGLIDSGFFADHKGGKEYQPRFPNWPEAVVDGELNWAEAMRRIYVARNISSGTNPGCLNKKGDNIADCFFAKNLAPHLRTPVFSAQPKFDQWQIWHVLGKPFVVDAVNQFGNTLMEDLIGTQLQKWEDGAFVDACTHHCRSCSTMGTDTWSSNKTTSSLEHLTPDRAFKRWYEWLETADAAEYGNPNVREFVTSYGKTLTHVSTHFYLQEGMYPCLTCCICHA